MSVREFFAGTENVAFETAVRFPFIKKIIEVIYPCTNFSKVTDRISKNIRRVIEIRRKGERPQATDMLQLMLDAQAGSESRAGDHRKNDLLIEDHHLLSNCFIFLLAGFETTATSLGFIMHLLAMHYDEQQRIFDELSAVFPEKDQDLTYDSVQQLKRLDMVIRESLRMYPPIVYFVSRTCKQDVTVMGQFFPSGVDVMVPTWHMHHDPDLWPDPYKFDPERFAEEKDNFHIGAYLPFGLGPRVCIGKRFAFLEMKMAICKVVRRYRVLPCSETQDPPHFVTRYPTIRIEKGIKVRLERR